MIAAEIKCRDPNAKFNKKNSSLEKLLGILKGIPLSDERDIEFVKAEETNSARCSA